MKPLALLILLSASRVAAAQAVAPRWTKLTLRQVPTVHDDSAVIGGRPVSVRPAARAAAVLRITIDNPCGLPMRVAVRESPQRVLTVKPIGAWSGHGRYICPGLLSLETYTATLTGLRAGEWRVQADSLTRFAVPGFVIR